MKIIFFLVDHKKVLEKEFLKMNFKKIEINRLNLYSSLL
jgi:hypothetical protein